jgi:chromosome segregation ATPase
MSAIESAASALARARAEAANATEALDHAKAAQGRVQKRADALDAERATIVAAARSGADDARAALRLEVITADRNDLSQVVSEHEGIVAKAQAAADQANAAVGNAQQMLDMTADSELLGKLTAHADRLDELLRHTLAELNAVTRRVGGRPRWAPSPILVSELQRLHRTAAQVRR